MFKFMKGEFATISREFFESYGAIPPSQRTFKVLRVSFVGLTEYMTLSNGGSYREGALENPDRGCCV